MKADFANLTLVAISQRLNLPAIAMDSSNAKGFATLDQDFDIYIRYGKQPF